MRVYHGTAHSLVDQIRDGGLVARPSAGVYVTASRRHAQDYAVRTVAYELLRHRSGDQRGAVLALDVPEDQLIPDENDRTGLRFYATRDVPPETIADVMVFDASVSIEELGADVLALRVETARGLEDWKAGLINRDPDAIAAPLRRLLAERG